MKVTIEIEAEEYTIKVIDDNDKVASSKTMQRTGEGAWRGAGINWDIDEGSDEIHLVEILEDLDGLFDVADNLRGDDV